MLDLIPLVVGMFTDNKDVVTLAVENKELLLGSSAAILLEAVMRLVPTKEHKSVLSVLIALCEIVLVGAKKLDKKLARLKKAE